MIIKRNKSIKSDRRVLTEELNEVTGVIREEQNGYNEIKPKRSIYLEATYSPQCREVPIS